MQQQQKTTPMVGFHVFTCLLKGLSVWAALSSNYASSSTKICKLEDVSVREYENEK
jgi:hypothetical protein